MTRGRIAVGLVLLVAVGLFVLRGSIAPRLMERALTRNMAADPLADLEDGLHVLLCGAGGPLPDPVRSGPCVAVIAGRTVVHVFSDAPPGPDFEPAEPDVEDVYFSTMRGHIGRRREQPEPAVPS